MFPGSAYLRLYDGLTSIPKVLLLTLLTNQLLDDLDLPVRYVISELLLVCPRTYRHQNIFRSRNLVCFFPYETRSLPCPHCLSHRTATPANFLHAKISPLTGQETERSRERCGSGVSDADIMNMIGADHLACSLSVLRLEKYRFPIMVESHLAH